MNESTENSDQPGPDKSAVDRASAGVPFLDSLFTRHQIVPHQRNRELAAALGQKWHSASRRASGSVPLTFDDFEAVAKHFGESLSESLQQKLDAEGMDAFLLVGEIRIACKLWLGEQTDNPTEGDLVAMRTEAGTWNVAHPPLPLGADPGSVRKIQRMVINPTKPQGWRVAVLDDQFEQATDLCSFCAADGLVADPYTTINGLEAAMQLQRYDAYVLDWLIDKETVRGLIQRIRSNDRASPILILTGQIETRRVAANDLEFAAAKFDLHLYEKPASLELITARLQRLLRAAKRPT